MSDSGEGYAPKASELGSGGELPSSIVTADLPESINPPQTVIESEVTVTEEEEDYDFEQILIEYKALKNEPDITKQGDWQDWVLDGHARSIRRQKRKRRMHPPSQPTPTVSREFQLTDTN